MRGSITFKIVPSYRGGQSLSCDVSVSRSERHTLAAPGTSAQIVQVTDCLLCVSERVPRSAHTVSCERPLQRHQLHLSKMTFDSLHHGFRSRVRPLDSTQWDIVLNQGIETNTFTSIIYFKWIFKSFNGTFAYLTLKNVLSVLKFQYGYCYYYYTL